MFGHVLIVLNGGRLPPGPVIVLFTLFLQGLTLFFVLSGFLLYRPFVAALLDDRPLPRPGRSTATGCCAFGRRTW